MKLIITRHGETIENAKKICQGHLGGNLSKEGKKQAKKLARRLKNEKIDVIYSSDLKRTKDTTEAVRKFHPSVPLFFDERIRERFFGDYQGTFYEENWAWRSIAEDPEGCIEDDLKMIKRIQSFLDEIIKKETGKTVLVVSHGGVKKLILENIFKKHLPEEMKIERIQNTSVSIFQVKDQKNIKPLILNCIRHLEE